MPQGRRRKYHKPVEATVTFEATEVRAVQDHAHKAGASVSETIRALVLYGLALVRQDRSSTKDAPS